MGAPARSESRSLSDLRQNPRAIVNRVRRTRRPVTILIDGKPRAMIVDIDEYLHQSQIRRLAELLAEGEDDIRRGRTVPLQRAFSEIRRAKKAPR